MRLHPVQRVPDPGFPTRDEVSTHPELLRLVPRRWQRNAVMLTAVATVGGLLAGIRATGAAEGEQKGPASRIAPIFAHGEGRASFGGLPMPGSYGMLNEDEARKIILEELQTVKLKPGADKQTIKGVELPIFPTDEKEGKTSKFDVVLDGTDEDKTIGFEFVSSTDMAAWKQVQMRGTASTSDFKGTATALRAALEQQKPAGAYGVFYEPIHYDQSDEKALAAARDELKKQVKDFIAWLKAEGVI